MYLVRNLLIIILLSGTMCSLAQKPPQKWVADTLVVSFGASGSIENCNFKLLPGLDLRPNYPRFISVFEKKKLIYFPVDQIIVTQKPLNQNLAEKFVSVSNETPIYIPTIHEFYARNIQTGKNRDFILFTTIELSQRSEAGDTLLIGTFYHKEVVRQNKRNNISEGYEKLIDQWAKTLNNDILAVQQNVDDVMPEKLYHFRRSQEAVNQSFYTSVDFFYGQKFWGFDGELWFAQPESSKKFKQASKLIRYQNHETYQSIAFGRNIGNTMIRLNNRLLFSNKNAFMIGINNWKDMATAHHKFEEILSLNLSATQKITFNRFDHKGFTTGVGLMENITYVVYHQPKVDIALVLNAAIKF